MKKIYKLGIIALLSMQLANNTIADEITFVIVQPDKKVAVNYSGVDFENWKALNMINVEPPQNATALIVEAGKPARWSTTPLPVLYRQLGGTGNLKQKIFPTGKIPKNIEIGKGSTQIELPEATDKTISLGFDGILPESGFWDVQLKNLNSKGCPPMISTVLAAQPRGEITRDFNFTLPFHPDQLFLDAKQLNWQETGLNTWRSTLADYGPNSKVQAKGMSFKVVWDVTIVSEIRIAIKSNIDVQLSPLLASAFGGSNHCSVNISGDYTRIWK